MSNYSLTHLGDGLLVRDLGSLVARDRSITAALLAHLAEFDSRRLYLPAAHPSTYSYCVHELRLSEDAAYKRIRAARAARRFPAIFVAVAEGKVHLAAVVLLAPYLTAENAGELLAAATHRSKAEIEEILAIRFPRTEALLLEQAIPVPSSPAEELPAPGRAGIEVAPGPVGESGRQEVRLSSCQRAPGHVGARSRVEPVAAGRFMIQLMIGQGTQDKLQHARNLLGHQIPSGDLSQVLDRALDTLIEKLEKRKLGANAQPRQPVKPSDNPRQVPAHVRRAVWERDRGQCTFTSPTGHRCSARTQLEFDHVTEVARGGAATFANLRLRCRAHNQYTAERTFGTEFMRQKRRAALPAWNVGERVPHESFATARDRDAARI